MSFQFSALRAIDAVNIHNDTDEQAAERIESVLRKWRDKHSDPRKGKP